MRPLRVPMHLHVSDIGQLYPPGTWTPETTPKEKFYTAIRLSYAPDHKTRAKQYAPRNVRFHVRVEDTATAEKIGGTTSVKIPDAKGLIYPEASSSASSATRYVSVTPLDPIPDGPKVNEAMIWRYPIEFSTSPKVTELLLEPGGGVQPTMPGAPKREAPPTPSKSGEEKKEPDWMLIAGIGVLVLGAGFLIYQLTAGGKKRVSALPAPEEA